MRAREIVMAGPDPARAPTTKAYGGGSTIILGIIAVAILIAAYMYMHVEPQTTDANPIPSTSGQMTPAPSGNTQAQGNTGPTTTEGKSSPAESPQGEAPPNMQAKPKGAE